MYEPQVNDYVLWKDHIEGWVYFKDQQYITIESWVRPKTQENYNACSIHKNNRLLVLCYRTQWDELTYVKSRESVYEEEKVYVELVGESIGGEGDEK
jgi:hypothetical protein